MTNQESYNQGHAAGKIAGRVEEEANTRRFMQAANKAAAQVARMEHYQKQQEETMEKLRQDAARERRRREQAEAYADEAYMRGYEAGKAGREAEA